MDTNLKKIKIFDTNFAHSKYSTDHQMSNFIEWYRDEKLDINEITFFTDRFLDLNVGSIENKIAWVLEPPSIFPEVYEYISRNNKKFNTVLTYDKNLVDKGENFVFYPHGGCWIPLQDQKIYSKNKTISMISSNKKITIAHSLRHEIIDKFKNKIDLYGRGFNPITLKTEGLKDYRYSIVVENIKMDYYFTEKLIDCFMTGTIPIYYGCPSIGKFFDIDGIITFNTIEELNSILYNLSEEDYNKKYKSVENNFNIAKEFLISEDWIYKNTKVFK